MCRNDLNFICKIPFGILFYQFFVIKLPLIIVHLLSDISVTYPKKKPLKIYYIYLWVEFIIEIFFYNTVYCILLIL